MKIHETRLAPNPRRVRIFLAEKNIPMTFEEIDIKAGENLTPEFRQKNPGTKVPLLEFDDGSTLSESVAICRYFEETEKDRPRLFGRTPLEKATVEMWQRQVEFNFFLPMLYAFQHNTGFFSDRMRVIPAWGEESASAALGYLDTLNAHLEQQQFLAGDYFSIADITLLCGIDFARVVKIRLGDNHKALKRWHSEVSARPSASA